MVAGRAKGRKKVKASQCDDCVVYDCPNELSLQKAEVLAWANGDALPVCDDRELNYWEELNQR